CTGRRLSFLRLRYTITHQMIRPHTSSPTHSAVIQEPVHRFRIVSVWLVMPGSLGIHPRATCSVEQPLRTTAARSPMAPRPAARRLEFREEGDGTIFKPPNVSTTWDNGARVRPPCHGRSHPHRWFLPYPQAGHSGRQDAP